MLGENPKLLHEAQAAFRGEARGLQVIAQALAAAGDREGAERARARSQRYGGTPSSD